MNPISRNKLFALALTGLVLVGGGCLFQAKTPDVKKPEVAVECQPVNDGYKYDAEDFYGWLAHIEKFPISEKYQELKDFYEGREGEGGDAILARFLTASDCSEDRAVEFLGKNLDESFGMSFVFKFSQQNYQKTQNLTEEHGFLCTPKDKVVSCGFNPQGSARNLLRIQPYVFQLMDLFEQG